MVNETYSIDTLLQYIKETAKKYNTQGMWLAKLDGKRWGFVTGLKATRTCCPNLVRINDEYGVFIEEISEISPYLKNMISDFRNMLNA